MVNMKCSICGNEFTGWGNSPWPIKSDIEARCCDDCNEEIVIPARIEKLVKNKDGESKQR